MWTVVARFSLFVTNVLVVVAQNSFLSDWVLSNHTLPYKFFRAFAAYDNVTNCIYGFGGTNTNNDAFIYNVTSNVGITRHINTSYTLVNRVSQNAVLIDNTWMYVTNSDGLLMRYNIFFNNISLIDNLNNHITSGTINDSAIVSNNPKNTNFYICDGSDIDPTTCIEWNIVTQTGAQISSVCETLLYLVFFLFFCSSGIVFFYFGMTLCFLLCFISFRMHLLY